MIGRSLSAGFQTDAKINVEDGMNNDSAVLDRDLERDTQQAERSALRKSDSPALPGATAPQSSSKRSLGDRIKGAFSNLAKLLEGDHGTHHFRS